MKNICETVSHKYNTRNSNKITKAVKTIQKHVRGNSIRNKLQRLSINSICSICLEEIYFDKNCSFLYSCRHVFHKICINKWKKYNSWCPNCRTKILNNNSNNYNFINIRFIFDIIHSVTLQLHGQE